MMIKETNKSVRDNNQTAELNTETKQILITNRHGRKTIETINIDMDGYLNAPGGFNKDYNQMMYIKKRNCYLDFTDPLSTRIIDSQRYAINKIIKQFRGN